MGKTLKLCKQRFYQEMVLLLEACLPLFLCPCRLDIVSQNTSAFEPKLPAISDATSRI